MEKYNPLVDEYIEKSQDFTQPILHYIREIVHEFCPDLKKLSNGSFRHLCIRIKFFAQWFHLSNIAAWDFGCMMKCKR